MLASQIVLILGSNEFRLDSAAGVKFSQLGGDVALVCCGSSVVVRRGGLSRSVIRSLGASVSKSDLPFSHEVGDFFIFTLPVVDLAVKGTAVRTLGRGTGGKRVVGLPIGNVSIDVSNWSARLSGTRASAYVNTEPSEDLVGVIITLAGGPGLVIRVVG